MLDSLLQYFQGRTPLQLGRDFLDITLVAGVTYAVLLVLKGTRAMQVGLGLALVFLLYAIAQWLQLITLLSVMGSLVSSIILVVVVVFQNDIRRALQRVGSSAWFSFSRSQESQVIDQVVEAATELARHRIGAIITFEQDANLDEFVGAHKGQVLDAQVSAELLVALFVPEGMNKLHDGSVIIRNLRIAKAGVFFPMPERSLDSSFGSRHRAALGITEETDAVVVIVSEERGSISFCFNGNIASNLDGPKLRTMLEAIFNPKVRKKSRRSQPPRRTLLPQPPIAAEPTDFRPDPLSERRSNLPPPPSRAPSMLTPEPPRLQASGTLESAPPPAPSKRHSDPPPPSQRRGSLDGASPTLEPQSLKRPGRGRDGQGRKSTTTASPNAPEMSVVLGESRPMPRLKLGDHAAPSSERRETAPSEPKPGEGE